VAVANPQSNPATKPKQTYRQWQEELIDVGVRILLERYPSLRDHPLVFSSPDGFQTDHDKT
jgi:hypothetical protein